ncbi:MAG: energy-coupling factor transporter ATPase [Calditrichia bacterium]
MASKEVKTSFERGTVLFDVEKYNYPQSQADTLTSLHFFIEKGDIVGLMGPTGAGKTTSLMLTNGLIPHFLEGNLEGNVIANSMDTKRYRIQTLSSFIGLVLQDPETQIFGITVEKDVAFGPSNLKYDKEKIQKSISDTLKSVGLAGYEKRLTAELSGGEKQRLAIAGVLAMQPEILVLDEPTSELDPEGRLGIFKLLAELKQTRNVTVLVSAHDSEEILQFVRKLIVLNNGGIAWQGAPDRLFKDIPLTKKLGIRPPEIAEIGHELSKIGIFKKEDIPLTLDDARRRLSEILKAKTPVDQEEPKSPLKQDRKPVIEISSLHYSYGKKHPALKGLNLEIYEGEFVALIGKNGAGKTTFSKHLNGLLRPTSGEIKIYGKNIAGLSIGELSKSVGYVFQNPDHQIFSSSVREEIEYGLRSYNISEEEKRKRVADAIEFVGLTGFEKRHPFTLGKGERQKLAVATVLAMEPQILVIDEPTTGQDWSGTQQMMKMIRQLHQKQHTILIITHDMRIAAEYADRVIVFSNGQIELDGIPSRVFSQIDKLKACSVSPPLSAVLAHQLQPYGMPGGIVTIYEIVQYFSKIAN